MTSQFWTDAVIYVIFVIAVVLIYAGYKLRGQNWKEYFSTKDGKGILKGIILAPVIIAILGFIIAVIATFAATAFTGKAYAQSVVLNEFRDGRWLNDASVFAGIDYTKKLSPMCDQNFLDDRGTSNMGVRANIWESASGNIRFNSKYTHHSCVIGSDNKSYDAIGVELEWVVFRRAR